MAKYDDALVLRMVFDDEIVVCSAPYGKAEVGDLVRLSGGGVGEVKAVVNDFDGSARLIAAYFTTIRSVEMIFGKYWSREKAEAQKPVEQVAEECPGVAYGA